MNTLIAGLPTLLGTVVGGLATFLTSRWAFNKRDRAETKRQRAALVRTVSTRFLNAVAKLQNEAMDKTKAKAMAATERTEAIGQIKHELIRAAATKQGVEDVVRKAQALIQEHEATQSLSHQMRGVADLTDCMGVMNTFIAEMRLFLPQKVLKKAELVATTAMATSLSSVMPDLPGAVTPDLPEASAKRDAANTDFVNALRKSFDLDLLTD